MLKKIGSLFMPLIVAAAFLGVAGLQLAHANEPRATEATVVKDWASLVDGAGASQDVTVFGAALGDYCVASMSVDLQGILQSCSVKAANTVTVRLQNETTGTIDLASGTLSVRVIKKGSLNGH